MTDFDFKEVQSEAIQQAAALASTETNEEIREKNLKHIAEISKLLSGPKTVLEVKRIHEGHVTVLGTIVSASEMYVVEESFSGSLNYRDAKSIQLEDIERPNENERLDVILYDDMIDDVPAGEVVEVSGEARIENKKGSKNKKVTVLHAESIKYLNRKELVISDIDIQNFQKFAKLPGLKERLVSMFAPNIIDHDDAKLGILRSVVGGIEHGKIRGRINTFMVGDPGTAKSTLAREAIDIKPNSRYVSGPHSSAKTITAIMEKENDGLVQLRLGAIPLSRGGICGVNEITEFQLDDQARLLDVLEEGIIPLNKHGTHMIIQSPTTIIATANPTQSTWNDSQKVSNDEIPMLRTLLDRFDQIYPFRDNMDIKQTYKFVEQVSVIRKRRPHNYNFLKKYLIYASSLEVTITTEAEFMLNQFWIHAKVQRTLTIRGYNALFRIAEAQAKLQLKNEVDAEIATQTMESVQLMMVQYDQTIKKIKNPRDMTFDAFLAILQDNKGPVEIKELCKMACKRDMYIEAYLGSKWSTASNSKLREVIRLLLNHPKVKQISMKPLVVEWLFDACDIFDENQGKEISKGFRIVEPLMISHTSNTTNTTT